MRINTVVLVAMVTAACGGDSDGGGMCEAPNGSYLMHLDERSGDCDLDGYETVISLGESSAGVSADCDGKETPSDDGCSSDTDQRCSIYDPATGEHVAEATFVGTLRSNESGTKLTGTATWHYVFDDGSECTSTVDLTYTKQ